MGLLNSLKNIFKSTTSKIEQTSVELDKKTKGFIHNMDEKFDGKISKASAELDKKTKNIVDKINHESDQIGSRVRSVKSSTEKIVTKSIAKAKTKIADKADGAISKISKAKELKKTAKSRSDMKKPAAKPKK